MNLSPLPIQKFFDNAGRPLNGGLLFTYTAGTSTKVATYTDSSGGTPNPNPVVLNFRGEANVWLDQTLTYKFVLSPANDSDPPTNPIWSVDNISAGITYASLTAQIIGQLLYPRTAAEITAGKTPTNYFYPESVINRYGTNTTPGTTDMTQPIKDAVAVHAAGGAPVQFLGQAYLITDTCITITNAMPGFVVRCYPYVSNVVNKAGASKPAYKLSGAQDFDLQLPVVVGKATFPNIGLELVKDGSGNRCGNGKLRDLCFLTNGGGLHIQDTNTLDIDGLTYWPSSFNPYGATIDANGQPYGLLADGTGAVNAVYLRYVNIGGLNTIANGGCGLKFDGSSSGAAFQALSVFNVTCEGGTPATFRSLWMRNVAESLVKNYFAENAECRFDNSCNTVEISIAAAATGEVVVDGTQALGGCLNLRFTDCNAKGITADAANNGTFQMNNNWSGATGNADSSINKIRINCRTTGSSLQTDILNILSWTTETFAAGNYTASSGNWTVASGDETTREYTLNGKTASVNDDVKTTTVSATPAFLFFALPASMQSKKDLRLPILYSEDNGTTTKTGVAWLQANSNQLALSKDLATTAWATTADLTLVSFSLTFEVV